MNQMIMFSASFSLHACWTSILFIRPNHFRKGVGHQKVSIQHNATHLLRAEDSFNNSAVSPSWISPGRASFSIKTLLSVLWNIFLEGA